MKLLLIYIICPHASKILSFQQLINIKILMNYFICFFGTKFLKSNVSFTLTAHLNSE